MKSKYKSRIAKLLAITLIAVIMLSVPGYAILIEKNVTSLTASYSNGVVTVNGTTTEGTLAVAIMIYNSSGSLLRMESFAVNKGVFTSTISITLTQGTYTVKAANYEGGDFFSTSFTYTPEEPDDTSTSPSTTEPPKASSSSGDQPISVDDSSNTATVDLSEAEADKLLSGNNYLTIPSLPEVNNYVIELPGSSLNGDQASSGQLTISTSVADITIQNNMLSTMTDIEDKSISISIQEADKSSLSTEENEAIGDRPVIQLTLSIDGVVTKWDNPDAAVKVSIPYTPTAEEELNPENIVVWYLDGTGNLICIPNGQYDSSTGMLSFYTTHFSLFAAGYNNVNFKDIKTDDWFYKAVKFIAAREITKGKADGIFAPNDSLTRAEFLVLLMRAYEIEPISSNSNNNFADAGDSYYTEYLAAAKELKITDGIGNNLFSPNSKITRQEMFTLLYRGLAVIDKLPINNNQNSLSSFQDSDQIATWAQEAMKLLVESGIVNGSDNKLLPSDSSTRAQMAQMLYTLLAEF